MPADSTGCLEPNCNSAPSRAKLCKATSNKNKSDEHHALARHAGVTAVTPAHVGSRPRKLECSMQGDELRGSTFQEESRRSLQVSCRHVTAFNPAASRWGLAAYPRTV